ncbi:MAG TPA: hypothetical protein DCS93_37730 [Microscillaceae bacterium]|nr:hypothetical protein [Microscillaceae bacterium]
MLKNYIVIAIRNMWKHKFYTVLNILGLALGLSTFLIIVLYLFDEGNYDHFHKDSGQIYRVTQTNIWSKDASDRLDALGPSVAKILTDLPEVKQACRVHPNGDYLGTYENKTSQIVKAFDEKKVVAVDSNFFSLFSFPLRKGNPQEVLNKPNQIVMSEQAARKYFGSQTAIGKTIKLSKGKQEQSFLVTGVVDNKSGESHIDFDMLISMSSLPEVKKRDWVWIWTTFVTYVKLEEKASLTSLQDKLKYLPENHAQAAIKRLYGQTYNDFISEYKPWHLYAQPLKEVYLNSSEAMNRLGTQGDIRYYYVFLAVGMIVILLSCINFMNLATARATQRAKEVGIRKVLGSYRRTLVGQFLCEALLFAFLGTILALGSIEIWLKFFNQIADKDLSLITFLKPQFIALIISLPFIIGFMAGLYPAFYLTRFRPTDALKGKMGRGKKGKILRNGLVVMQFSISSILIVASLVLFQQLKSWQNKKLGFDHKKLIVIPKVERLGNQANTFQQKLLQHTNITKAGFSDVTPPNAWMQDYLREDKTDAVKVPFNMINANADYLDMLSLEVVQGRVFSKKFATDSNAVIINEAAARMLGWQMNEAIGKKLFYEGSGGVSFKVIGVLKDFHFTSLHQNIAPFAFFYLGSKMFSFDHRYLTFKVNRMKDASDVLSYVEQTWKKMAPSLPFEYQFLDQLFMKTYKSEQRTSNILMVFTGLALFIAGLGLVGLATFSAERRSKEIGVRKVLGASVLQIFALLSKEYIRLIGLSLLISIPVAYYIMQHWLQNFTYRISIGWQSFAWTALIALIVAGIAVMYQSLRAAFVNPIESLRDE